MYVGTSVNGGQKTVCGSPFPILTMLGPGTELRLSGLVSHLAGSVSTSLIGTVFPHCHTAVIVYF